MTKTERRIKRTLDERRLNRARKWVEEAEEKQKEEERKREEENKRMLQWLEGRPEGVRTEEVQRKAPADTGVVGANKRHPDTGESGAKRRKYSDTGG